MKTAAAEANTPTGMMISRYMCFSVVIKKTLILLIWYILLKSELDIQMIALLC